MIGPAPSTGGPATRRGSGPLVGVAFFVVAFVAGCASSPPPALDATHLPVFVIDTFGGGVPDEPKAPARLRLVVDGYGGRQRPAGAIFRRKREELREPPDRCFRGHFRFVGFP